MQTVRAIFLGCLCVQVLRSIFAKNHVFVKGNDSLFLDLEKILTIYRKDWFHWREVVKHYEQMMKINDNDVCSTV